MKKILLGGLVGGVILFLWSFLAWVILPLHSSSLHGITNEDAVITALQQSLAGKAVYMFPHNPGKDADQAAQDAWVEKMKRGPSGLIMYNPYGTDPMMPRQMIIGVLLDFVAALLVSWLLTRSTAFGTSYISRVAFCGMFALFVTIFDYLMMWNWMGYPRDFTVALIVDAFIGLLLAGLGIAAIVKSSATKSA
jgi:hypothetical protein